MLPPLEPAVSSANPRFEALYNNLCETKLSPDGTSVLDSKSRQDRDVLSEQLHQARLNAARRDLINNALTELTYTPSALPDELHELVAVAAALLDGQISAEDAAVVQEDVEKFKTSAWAISSSVSQQLQRDAALLSSMLSAGQGSHGSDLTKSILLLKGFATTSRQSLSSGRFALAHDSVALHDLYRQVLEASIRILELTIHGSVSRASRAKADYLAVVAEGMSKKLAVQHGQLMSQVYSLDLQNLLKDKHAEMAKEVRALKRSAEEEVSRLEKYRSARGMEGLAREYADVLNETGKVKDEIDRLDSKT